MIVSGLQFCAHCDYAISRIEMDSYRGDLDKTMCPRCGMCRLSMFYSYGSQCHINRREAWERGEVTGAPLPVPNATGERPETRSYDAQSERHRIAVAYVGENGIMPNRKYTLNDSHEFVEVE